MFELTVAKEQQDLPTLYMTLIMTGFAYGASGLEEMGKQPARVFSLSSLIKLQHGPFWTYKAVGVYNGQPKVADLMLTSIKHFFDQYIAPHGEEREQLSEHSLQLATAALLIEMMRMDDDVVEEERRMVRGILNSWFSLSEREIEQLLALAEEEAAGLADYYQFTSFINKSFSPEQRAKLVEHLWQVAYADGHLDKHEEHLVRKLADLLHVRHSAFIAAKHRAVK